MVYVKKHQLFVAVLTNNNWIKSAQPSEPIFVTTTLMMADCNCNDSTVFHFGLIYFPKLRLCQDQGNARSLKL